MIYTQDSARVESARVHTVHKNQVAQEHGAQEHGAQEHSARRLLTRVGTDNFMQKTQSITFHPALLRVSAVLGLCLLMLAGCKSRTSDADQTPGPTENARASGAAEDASKDALIGTWRLTPATHDAKALDADDIDLLNGFDEIVRAGFEFREDGTYTFGARLADDALQEKEGTWRLDDVALKTFAVHLDAPEGADTPPPLVLVVEPRSDGHLNVTLNDDAFVLRSGSMEDYLAAPDTPTPKSGASKDSPTKGTPSNDQPAEDEAPEGAEADK